MYGRVLEDAMRHTTSRTVSVLEYLTEYAKDSISLIETCFYINFKFQGTLGLNSFFFCV